MDTLSLADYILIAVVCVQFDCMSSYLSNLLIYTLFYSNLYPLHVTYFNVNAILYCFDILCISHFTCISLYTYCFSFPSELNLLFTMPIQTEII